MGGERPLGDATAIDRGAAAARQSEKEREREKEREKRAAASPRRLLPCRCGRLASRAWRRPPAVFGSSAAPTLERERQTQHTQGTGQVKAAYPGHGGPSVSPRGTRHSGLPLPPCGARDGDTLPQGGGPCSAARRRSRGPGQFGRAVTEHSLLHQCLASLTFHGRNKLTTRSLHYQLRSASCSLFHGRNKLHDPDRNW